jgi:hypothetical protein
MGQSAMIKRPWPYILPTIHPNTFGVRQILHRPVPSRQEDRVVTLDPPVGAGAAAVTALPSRRRIFRLPAAR